VEFITQGVGNLSRSIDFVLRRTIGTLRPLRELVRPFEVHCQFVFNRHHHAAPTPWCIRSHGPSPTY
jgi:hypothetical protein